MFPKLKGHLSGMNFKTNDEVKEEVMKFFNGIAGKYFEEDPQKWMLRLQ